MLDDPPEYSSTNAEPSFKIHQGFCCKPSRQSRLGAQGRLARKSVSQWIVDTAQIIWHRVHATTIELRGLASPPSGSYHPRVEAQQGFLDLSLVKWSGRKRI
jgi:hypothetical protein